MRECPDVGALTGLFFEAAEIERRLPSALRLGLQASWPDAPDDWQAFGWHEVEFTPRPATPAEVDRYDLALRLTPMLPPDERRVVWAVAHSAVRRSRGPAWSKIARVIGVHPDTVKRRFEWSILTLFFKLQHSAAK